MKKDFSSRKLKAFYLSMNTEYWTQVDSTEVWTKEHTSLDGHRGRQGVTTSEIKDLRERILEDG